MDSKQLFKSDLIDLNVDGRSASDFFEFIGKKLAEKNYVLATFSKAIIEREEAYPTGLQLENFSVAIPHTDTQYILEPFVSVNRLKEPIVFYQMGTDDIPVEVRDVFVLGIKEPKKQVGLLAQLMELFANKDFVDQYQQAQTNEEIINLINKYLS